MKVIVSFDYELFFGDTPGTAERCLIEPTAALRDIAARHGAPFAYFVDAGYLWRMEADRFRDTAISETYDMVRRQLAQLAAAGHDLQLHVHPHWEDTRYEGGNWRMNLARFRLHAFGRELIRDIVARYKAALCVAAQGSDVFCYRAGGWALQPFDVIASALKENGIYVDSSVYPHGVDTSSLRCYDFRGAPPDSVWRFEEDPLRKAVDGYFTEVAISSIDVKPSYYWRLAWTKKFGGSRYQAFGDGVSRSFPAADIWTKLTRRTHYCVTLDGYKASLLHDAYRRYVRRRREYLVLLSHPKTLTRHSLKVLDDFLTTCRGDGSDIVGYADFKRS
ncbi:MAG: hypothetical protein IT529_21555 [Burkholderiales bacterium]|nr:hypothetical protein [Burkholderiales bacterium]